MWNDPFFDVLIWFSHEWEKTNMSANNTDTLRMLLRDLFHQLNSVSNIYWQNWMMGTHYLGELFKDRRMRIKKDVYITWQLGFMLIVFPGRDSTTWKTAKDSWMQPFHDLCVETWCSQAFFSFQGFIFPVLATHIYDYSRNAHPWGPSWKRVCIIIKLQSIQLCVFTLETL